MKTNLPFKNLINKVGLKKKDAQQKLKVGLDISSAAIRIVGLYPDKEKPTLVSFAYVPIEDTIGSSIRKAIASLPTTNYQLNVGLSGSGVVIRYINLPKMTRDELKGAMRFEAEKHIPFPLVEVILDTYILDENFAGNQMLVLLAAVKNDLISQCIQLMRSAGIEVAIIDISTVALINAFLHYQAKSANLETQTKPAALLDIGLKFSGLNIIEGRIPRLSRDISVGSKSFETVDKEAILSNLADEVRRSFDFYESESNKPLDVIFLSGEGSRSEGIEQFIASNFSIPVKFWDPSENCIIAPSVNKELLQSQSHTLGVSLGLALR
ncbi:MAG: pilus assembly protein PilM [Candidatus Omnitrophota bacterium]